MSDLDARLEKELAALRPRPLSAALKRRIETELLVQPDRQSRVVARWALLVGCGALALGLVLGLLWPRRPEKTGKELVQHVTPMPLTLDLSRPSVWAYRRALADPAVDLNALLDEHRGTTIEHPAAQPSAFPVSIFKQPSWMGEL